MQPVFRIHQALFGYDSGHQLLAASTPLPSEALRFLAVATDMSGSAPSEGFDHAFTGTPVPGTYFYALFATWLATEMPRPGCVWSHVLLVDLADLAEISELGALRGMFKRPASAPSQREYAQEMRFSEEGDTIGPRMLPPLVKPGAVQILDALYDRGLPVVIPATTSVTYEDLLFSLWSQQWPKLRRNFRFSTGSFADRGRGGPVFDLQVTPKANLAAWPRERSVLSLLDSGSTETASEVRSDWMDIVVQDLSESSKHGFREFTRAFGADVSVSRGSFASFARIYRQIIQSGSESWKAVLQLISTEYPSPDEAVTLKNASVSRLSELDSDYVVNRQLDIVQFLCTDDNSEAYAEVSLDFSPIVSALWPSKRDVLIEIVAGKPLGEDRWTQLTGAVAAHVDARDLPWLWENRSDFLFLLIQLNPQIAAIGELWKLPHRAQWRALEALESISVPEDLWRQMVTAMLSAGTSIGASDVVQHAGDSALNGAMDWVTHSHATELPSYVWRDALRSIAERRLERENLSPAELVFCAVIASNKACARLQAWRPDVQALAAEPLDNLPLSLRVPAAFLLVAIGLQTLGNLGTPLLARGFIRAYESLEGAEEPPEAWRMLQPHLPKLRLWDEWDRCLKLRLGLEKWLSKNPDALESIVDSANTPNQKRWLKSLR